MDYRKSNLDDIVGNNEPDIIFLPGDEPDMSSSVLTGYRQAQVAHNDETVARYCANRK
jgi:UDP-N-acetylglucosamine 2-epimerase